MPEQVSDATLLERFVSRREEAAFVALVKRHGPRVHGICRRVLHNEHDIEDVFQATFFVLARKAGAIPWRPSMGGWLCAVAHRLAMGARADASRQRRRETSFGSLLGQHGGQLGLPDEYHPLANSFAEVERGDLRRVLDDELLQLPEKYRAPVVLCDLEGRTHHEAALELGWPSGSISRRLTRARALLRRRLTHRGVTLTIGVVGIGLVALLIRTASQRDDGGIVAVRKAMTPLGAMAKHGSATTSILASIDRDEPVTEPSQIIALARQAAAAASKIVSHDPRRNREDWRNFAVEMRLSAMQLAQATEAKDRSAMLLASRRLDASCSKCHEVFHQ
jgi:RNA polymerase sigma-70 factor (ECF subfamily)